MEALKGEHGEEFRATMLKEIKALKNKKTWTLIHKSALPDSAKVIPTTWAMKIKRFPIGAFRSFKARFCVRGDLQKKAVSNIDTFSPVVQCNAFAQAETKGDPVYISLPPRMDGFPPDH
eukprot:13574784-Ditylum_brightwellii.AAC.1